MIAWYSTRMVFYTRTANRLEERLLLIFTVYYIKLIKVKFGNSEQPLVDIKLHALIYKPLEKETLFHFISSFSLLYWEINISEKPSFLFVF